MKADVHAHENTDATHTKTDSEVQYQYVYTVTILRHARNKSESLLSNKKNYVRTLLENVYSY